jgi:hypothetical protein
VIVTRDEEKTLTENSLRIEVTPAWKWLLREID